MDLTSQKHFQVQNLKMITWRDPQLLGFQDFFAFQLPVYFFDRQFRLFSFSGSITYSDAEISIIS